jgi:hypothetical protein
MVCLSAVCAFTPHLPDESEKLTAAGKNLSVAVVLFKRAMSQYKVGEALDALTSVCTLYEEVLDPVVSMCSLRCLSGWLRVSCSLNQSARCHG